MTSTRFARGTLKPILYFENSRGEIMLPPTDDTAYEFEREIRRRGYVLREAGTLDEIDKLQKRLQEELYRKNQEAIERHEVILGPRLKQIREDLEQRAVSAATTQYERDFIKDYLRLREDKRAEYRRRYMCDTEAYFALRENNSMHRVIDSVDNVPDMKQDTCKKCGKFRRVKGSELCALCERDVSHG